MSEVYEKVKEVMKKYDSDKVRKVVKDLGDRFLGYVESL